jgi:hypothetical protein
LNSWLLILAVVLCAGCSTSTRLPPVNLSQPGWRVRQGQALWKPPGPRPEIAGDLLLATKGNGDFFLQVSKVPFTVATAEGIGGSWEIQFGSHDYHRRGRGKPPKNFVWFELPEVLAGVNPGRRWSFSHEPDGQWRLANSRSGETLAGRFFP